MERYTLSVLVENNPGVLSRVVGLFSRRGFNIHSLSVGTTQDPQVSRITIEVNGDAQIVEQVSKQLSKIMEVIKIKTDKQRCLIFIFFLNFIQFGNINKIQNIAII